MGSRTNDASRVYERSALWTKPDHVEEWRVNAGPVLQEPPSIPLRRQTEADLGAARWCLLAWEAPWLKRLGAPF